MAGGDAVGGVLGRAVGLALVGAAECDACVVLPGASCDGPGDDVAVLSPQPAAVASTAPRAHATSAARG
ncbi:MAG: hypothetical protein ACRDQA_19410 [Nocardioidaceae bacterium]